MLNDFRNELLFTSDAMFSGGKQNKSGFRHLKFHSVIFTFICPENKTHLKANKSHLDFPDQWESLHPLVWRRSSSARRLRRPTSYSRRREGRKGCRSTPETNWKVQLQFLTLLWLLCCSCCRCYVFCCRSCCCRCYRFCCNGCRFCCSLFLFWLLLLLHRR